ncbi:T9SS type A sorting domain-containing protein [bacterium]|nr:T9SS type A sorting domain-containing protein [bacterium]
MSKINEESAQVQEVGFLAKMCLVLVQNNPTMKTLYTTILSLVLAIPSFGQISFLKTREVTQCQVTNQVYFWLAIPSGEENNYTDFSVNGLRRGKVTDTIIMGNLHCFGNNFVVSVRDLKNEMTLQQTITIINACSKKYSFTASLQLIDSALQTAATTLSISSEKLGYTPDSIHTQMIQLFDQNGAKSRYGLSFNTTKNGGILKKDYQYNLSPGKYLISNLHYQNGKCVDLYRLELIIGHFTNFRVDKAKMQLLDSTYYWQRYGAMECDASGDYHNTTCIDTGSYFYMPTLNHTRFWRSNNLRGYQLPAIPEKIAVDFDSDGTIDFETDNNWEQSHKYRRIDKKPFGMYQHKAIELPFLSGEKNMTVWSRDSLGQWQKNTRTYTFCDGFTRSEKFKQTASGFKIENPESMYYSGLYISIYEKTGSGKDSGYQKVDSFYSDLASIEKTLPNKAYRVYVMSDNKGCDQTKVYYMGIRESVDDADAKMVIYPALTHDVVNISCPNNTLSKIAIYSSSGEIVLEQSNLTGTNHQVSLQSLQSGAYFVRLQTQQGIYFKKVVKY